MTTVQRYWIALPLRSRLALITTGLLTGGMLVSSLVFTTLLEDQLMRQVDTQLSNTGQTVGTQAVDLVNASDQSDTSRIPTDYHVAVRYFNDPHDLVLSTAKDYGIPLINTVPLDRATEQQIHTVGSTLPNERWRVLVLPVQSKTDKADIGIVAIALPLHQVDETLVQIRIIVAFTDVSVILLGAAAATYLVRRSFRPLRQIERVAGRIASGDLSARVLNTEPATTEVGSLQRALNMMLQRNEQAFDVQMVAQERMTRFVSDASHELRTPLAAIRGYGELYRMGGVPQERTEEVMGRIESEASRMGRLVDDLLQLARMDEGREMMMERVDLTAVASGVLTDMMVLAPQRTCTLIPLDDAAAGAQPPAVTVLGDKDRLAQVLTNLLGNVRRYTPEDSPVEIAIGLRTDESGGATAVVEVRDHGPGVSEQDAEKVFQRFYRADTSRNREKGGSGLGLAIVSAIVSRHRGTVQMLHTPGGGATVRIELPAEMRTAAARSPEDRRGTGGPPPSQDSEQG